jgi:hypothetical protein
LKNPMAMPSRPAILRRISRQIHYAKTSREVG